MYGTKLRQAIEMPHGKKGILRRKILDIWNNPIFLT